MGIMSEPVTRPFQAEVSQVLHLVIHSLYSNKEIFLRELVSNAADALDKLRFRAITEPALLEGDSSLVIRLHVDESARTLTIEDNGVGMTEEEVAQNLGTVAHSGSRAFLEQLAQSGNKDARLIGQFGVGFYSAYLVADRVEVVTRAAGGATATKWISEGKDTFSLEPAERASRGTSITLHLKEEQAEFAQPWRLRELVTRYSDYVSYPIQLETKKKEGESETTAWETVNRASALWQRSKSEIKDSEYDEFFQHLAHLGTDAKPLARAHFKVEGTQEFAGLLFVPAERSPELRFGMKPRGVRLYVKRVLIMEECEELVPEWMRFVVGVVDSDDLPLNVSRELLQESPAVRVIRKTLVKQVLDALDAMASERPDDFKKFYEQFGVYLKEGAATDYENKDRLARLLRWESTFATGLTSLGDYVARMKEGQPAIYYAVGESRLALEGAPHLEGLKKRGYEVLFMVEPIDQWVSESLRELDGKKLISAMQADLKLEESEDEKKAREIAAGALEKVLSRTRAVLGDRVREVRWSERLTDSPCCLVIGRGAHGSVQRALRDAGREVPPRERIFELNPSHPVLRNLEALVEKNDPQVAECLELLYDQAVLTEGAPLDDPGAFARRMTDVLLRLTKGA